MADAQLDTATREAVRDLILVLADSKRLLGMRYAGWMLGAPEIEAGIACASMAQDEWGHARLLYSLLRDFNEDVDRIEHGREPHEYHNIETLDGEPGAWADLVALNVLVDGALTAQLAALRESAHAPLRHRVEKMIDEERFHTAHGAAWFRRLGAAGGPARAALRTATLAIAPAVLRWFGPDDERAARLQEGGIADGAGSALRDRFLHGIEPLLASIDAAAVGGQPAFDAFDPARRRTTGTAPDAETILNLRGDRNRAFLMD